MAQAHFPVLIVDSKQNNQEERTERKEQSQLLNNEMFQQ